MAPELVAAFIEEFTAEINRNASQAELDRRGMERGSFENTKKINAILKAIEDGMYTPSMKVRMEELEARKSDL